MEVCPGFELIAIENATALGHDVLELSKRGEAQMIRHMRHGSPPRLIALQSILSPNRRESLPTPSAGVRMRQEHTVERMSRKVVVSQCSTRASVNPIAQLTPVDWEDRRSASWRGPRASQEIRLGSGQPS